MHTSQTITIDDLIRNRAQQIGSTNPDEVAASLSCERLRDQDVALNMVEAVRRFRKLRSVARVARVRRTLSTPEVTDAQLVAKQRIEDARRQLSLSLTRLTPQERLQLASAIEALIDAKLGIVGDALPDPNSPFRWSSRSPLVEECWVGPVVIGHVSAVRVENDGSVGIYEAAFGAGSHIEKIPGQHALAVAKKRIEDRYREWAQRSLSA